MKFFLSLSFFFLGISGALASPFPATGTSEFVNPQKPYLFHRKGFEINPQLLPWQSQALKNKNSELSVLFSDPHSGGKIQVQTETMTGSYSIESYSKKWLKDYQAYGFELLGAKPFVENKAKGYLVDLFFRKDRVQQRQAIFIKNNEVVTISCLDQESHFSVTLNHCNQILKSFHWL